MNRGIAPEATWHIAMRPGKRRGLEAGSALAERVKAQVRARVEHPFRVVKRQFGYVKVRYRGLAKNTAQLTTLFALSNLWMVRHTVRVGEGGACPEAFGRRPGGPTEASWSSAARARTPFGRVEPPRDGSPAKFRRPLTTDPDETDRDDVPGTRDSALRSASLILCLVLTEHSPLGTASQAW